jgi:hypothetical protein
MQMTMAFNKDLPQSITDWPGFFNENSVKPAWASFVLANYTMATDATSPEIFFIAENYKYDASNDDLRNNTSVIGVAVNSANGADKNTLITGDLVSGGGVSAVAALNAVASLKVTDDGTNSGTLQYTSDSGFSGVKMNANGSNVVWAVQTDASYEVKPADTGDSTSLWQYQADKYLIGNKDSSSASDYLWFAKENYGISNTGAIKTVGDFTNSSTDIFSLLNNSALESVMYIKTANSALTTFESDTSALHDIGTTDMFDYGGRDSGMGTNIDVVFIPDLLVAAVQQMLPAINNLKD